MKYKSINLLLLYFFSIFQLTGQPDSSSVSMDLEKLFGRLINNYSDSARIQINDSITYIIENYVESDTVFQHRFNNLRYLGQVTSPDSLLKIVTWNLVLVNKPGRYYCYIIRKQHTGGSNMIYRLTTEYREEEVTTETIYKTDNWYGALYYDIRPFPVNNNVCWVVLGIDYGNPLITRKIIDVISFAPDESIVFGMKWFLSSGKVKFRDVFEYASNATMSLRFSSGSSIVFDHLVPFSRELLNDRQYYGPDYSSDAYFFEEGSWRLKINVDARNKE